MAEQTNFQLTIHVKNVRMGFPDKVDLIVYLEKERRQAEIWGDFDHLPLLKVVDEETGEVFKFEDFKKLPTSNLVNSLGEVLIYIGPQQEETVEGVNTTTTLEP